MIKLIAFFSLLFFTSLSFSSEIKLIISSGAGGITHRYALAIAPIISNATNKTVVLDIKSGAEGYIAADYVNSKNDSTETILLIGTPKKWTPTVNKSNISHVDSFNIVSYLGNTPTVIAINKAKKINNIKELLEYSKTNKVSYGISMNNPFRVAMAELIERYGNKDNIVEVTYKSGSVAINDAIGHHTDVVISTYESLNTFISRNMLIPLAISTPKKSNPSGIKTLEEQDIYVKDEFKYYANIFLWSNLGADKNEIDVIRNAILKFLLSEESLNLRRDMYITYEIDLIKNPAYYLSRVLK